MFPNDRQPSEHRCGDFRAFRNLSLLRPLFKLRKLIFIFVQSVFSLSGPVPTTMFLPLHLLRITLGRLQISIKPLASGLKDILNHFLLLDLIFSDLLFECLETLYDVLILAAT